MRGIVRQGAGMSAAVMAAAVTPCDHGVEWLVSLSLRSVGLSMHDA